MHRRSVGEGDELEGLGLGLGLVVGLGVGVGLGLDGVGAGEEDAVEGDTEAGISGVVAGLGLRLGVAFLVATVS
jgi:hypothetical protein